MKVESSIIKTTKIAGAEIPKEVDDFAKLLGVDQNIWEVSTYTIKDGRWTVCSKYRDQDLTFKDGVMDGHAIRKNDWIAVENKTYSISVTFKRKSVESNMKEIMQGIVDNMSSFGFPTLRKRKSIIEKGVAAELALYDAHFGKLAWKNETGYRHYDVKIATQDYMYAAEKALDLIIPHHPEKIFYIIGQDQFHVDNMASHTTQGDHTLDVDGRLPKIIPIVFGTVRDIIYKACQVAPVEVIWIPGNHDYVASFSLGLILKEHFRLNPRVTVDVSENPRKARLWGNLLVGWTHRITSKHTVWSNELAQEFPELWGKSFFREWHHGDQHKKQTVKVTPIFTSGGVVCRQMTALSPVDQWHSANVFTDAIPGGEAYLWSKTTGVFANYTIWTGQYDKNRNELVNKK
jgi:hypothetical protein